jgi:hypothetical protein
MAKRNPVQLIDEDINETTYWSYRIVEEGTIEVEGAVQRAICEVYFTGDKIVGWSSPEAVRTWDEMIEGKLEVGDLRRVYDMMGGAFLKPTLRVVEVDGKPHLEEVK